MKNSPNKTNNSPPPPIENPVMQLTSSMAFIGPLPPPEAFEKYERTHAGAADRIIKMAENEANHRRELEKKALVHNIWVAHLSQFFAFILSITGLSGGVYCIVNDQPWAGVAVGGASLVALVSAFLKKK